MSDIIKTDGGGLVSLLHGKGGGLTIPKPFEKDIFLFDSHVAGTSFIEGIEELEPHLNIDDRLDFFREPDNKHDPKAIVIKNTEFDISSTEIRNRLEAGEKADDLIPAEVERYIKEHGLYTKGTD